MLVDKCEAGADRAITQFFFKNEDYYGFLDWPMSAEMTASPDLVFAIRHEVLGLIAYRLLGYTTAFSPGPHDNI